MNGCKEWVKFIVALIALSFLVIICFPVILACGSALLGLTKGLLEKLALAVKKWQFRFRNYVGFVFLPHFPYSQVAFATQNCTVIGDSSTPKFSRHYRNRITTNRVNLLFTPSTHNPVKPLFIEPSLPFSRISDNSPVEIHTSPPKVTWTRGETGHDWFGNQNGNWLGLHIDKIFQLWVSVNKLIKLKHPSYHISFCPYGDTHHVCDLVDCPTLMKAEKLAESYYREWLSVNQNFDTLGKSLYPLTERLEDKANGNSVPEGDNRNGT